MKGHAQKPPGKPGLDREPARTQPPPPPRASHPEIPCRHCCGCCLLFSTFFSLEGGG